MSVLCITAVNLKNYSTPSGQEQWGHGSTEITLVLPSSSPSVTQRECQSLSTLPSSLSTLLFPHKWLIQGLSIWVLFSSTAGRCHIMCSNTEAQVCAPYGKEQKYTIQKIKPKQLICNYSPSKSCIGPHRHKLWCDFYQELWRMPVCRKSMHIDFLQN